MAGLLSTLWNERNEMKGLSLQRGLRQSSWLVAEAALLPRISFGLKFAVVLRRSLESHDIAPSLRGRRPGEFACSGEPLLGGELLSKLVFAYSILPLLPLLLLQVTLGVASMTSGSTGTLLPMNRRASQPLCCVAACTVTSVGHTSDVPTSPLSRF